MKSFYVIRFSILTLTTLLVPGLVFTPAQAETDWEDVPASVIHQKLWEGKVSAALDKEFVRQLAAMAPVENTQTNYDVLFYDVDIRVNDTAEIIYGIVKMIAAATIDDVAEVQVDFHDGMILDSIQASSGPLAFSRLDNVVTVTLDAVRNSGEQFEAIFYYYGHPTEGGFQGFSFAYHNGTPVISSLSEPYFARSWWPCKDRMDDKADSMDIAITVDTAFYAASNGILDSTVSSGANAHTFYWSVRYPIVTYLFSVAISDYKIDAIKK